MLTQDRLMRTDITSCIFLDTGTSLWYNCERILTPCQKINIWMKEPCGWLKYTFRSRHIGFLFSLLLEEGRRTSIFYHMKSMTWFCGNSLRISPPKKILTTNPKTVRVTTIMANYFPFLISSYEVHSKKITPQKGTNNHYLPSHRAANHSRV